MLAGKFMPLIFKQVWRARTRSLLTLVGVATAMFLFCAVHALDDAVTRATKRGREDTTLVVYRENRYCPATSRLPQRYESAIMKISGVRSVVPMKIVVNNCRVGLDVVTFRGVEEKDFGTVAAGLRVLSGSKEAWGSRGDSALVGEALARRRNLKVGQSFDAAGVNANVAAIVTSPEAQDQNVAYVHMDFLQRSTTWGGVGVVTQFNVKVDDPARLDSVAAAIDAEFAHDEQPTRTRPEKAFVAQLAGDILSIVAFTRWLGYAALAAVLALVGNAVILSVQDRIKEHAILQTLGFRGGLIARLIVGEGLLLSLAGGAAGTAIAVAILRVARFSLSMDGVSMNLTAGFAVIGVGLAVSAALGVVAGLVPAFQASRREIAACFRAV